MTPADLEAQTDRYGNPIKRCKAGHKFPIGKCPNMKEEDSCDMEKETYQCDACGKREHLYYDEMR